ncbi:pogo transposable element with ZNF domain isoform X2 [Danio rerio]|uniref:Pogo transposable element with ZNF domain isoform X2 n=2 Tax=Danio rerio TaxID=7955 RepID=A0AC58HGV9_DANRE|nr:pogo transposable element with ZNF domain isoform X1 [Danio rerio]|eukprot:XP_003200290.1 pogo transposable element with ZNF domain isoform X1 [Danio rerio]
MDSDLFMECEEEELEPWQQQSMDEPAGNAESSTPSVTSTPAPVVDVPAPPKTMVIPSLTSVVNAANTVPLITNTITQRAVVPTEIPKAVQGQPVILAPGGGGLGTVALSQVLLPGTSIANVTNSQPIYFTTQGLPVQNIQPGQGPMSLVLNVQQGQTVRPITLLQAPGTQIFKPAIGATQIITQPAQIRAGAPVVNRAQTPSTFSTVQIPATLTFRTTNAVTPTAASSLPIVSSTTITQPTRTTTKIVTIKQGNGPLDMQNLMNLVKSVNLPGGAQAQTFVVMSNQNTKNGPVVSSAVPIISQNVIQTIPLPNATSSTTTTHLCPRCGAQFRMIEALRGHMCFCCPDLVHMTETSSTPTAVKPPATPPKSASVVPSAKVDSPPSKTGDSHPRLVMLVDDFYYGTFEGNRVYVPMDNSKEPLSFRCLTCSKKLKNNIRLMNHMRYHVELDQQNGEMDNHTSCQHCFRRFPTPFRLQCHLESVHTSIESSTKCKICEWSFENEPVFLQHMKNSHKPGEMPYVCQVCEYRSSFYSDVFNHFRTWHEDTRHLLCQYCLKVFKHSTSYQQHYVRHQKSTVYHCNKCRLQFLFTKDKVEHKINHHRTFRKPRELDGLQPGTKVTIRAYVGKKTPGQSASKASTNIQKNSISSSQSTTLSGDQQSEQQQSGKKQVSKMFQFLSKFQEQRAQLGRHKCVECTFDIPDFVNHYPTYVHCSLCFYSTCCSRAYANHMINNHVPGRAPKPSKKGPPSVVKLTCAGCEYSTPHGNLMAKHLIKFPDHSYCLFMRKGSAKVGFVDSKRDGTEPGLKHKTEMLERGQAKSSVDISNVSQGATAGQDEDVDQEMAPLEDEDTETDTDTVESSEEVPLRTVASEKEKRSLTKPTQPVRNREESLTIHQRRILLLALCAGIQKAAKEMDTKPQLIKTWIQDKEDQLNECCSSICGEAVDRLVQWVLTQREQQRPINEARLFEKASELQSQTNETSSFRISYEWAVNFMMQHKLGLDTCFTVQRELPSAMEENCRCFKELVHGQVKTNNVPQCVIGVMDQLSVFVDINMLNEKNKVRRDTAIQFTGSGKPFVKIYLAMLANGTMLPAALFTSHTTSTLSSTPDTVLIMAKEEGYKATEELEIWATKVWKQHLDSQNEKEALLVLDSHHCLTSESIISTVSSTKTFLPTIPAGCTCRHQPLEMCVRPVLQRLFLSRWAQQPKESVQPEDLMQLLVSWLDKAMSCFSSRPEFIQHSFCLAHLLPDQETHTDLPGTSVELLNILSEATLGPEVVDLESADEEEPMDTHSVDNVTEKIDLTEEQEDTENELNDDKAKNTEQQKETNDECLEIASESTDFSHSSPEHETPSHNSEPDHLSESGLDANTDQTDSANR